MSNQDEIFQAGEGDSWFERNAAVLQPGVRHDAVLRLFEANAGRLDPVATVCDAGCANGWRLAALATQLPAVKRLVGFDASQAAVESGLGMWPRLDLRVGLLDEPPALGEFDLVIVSFVFHWVDRSRIARAIAAVDSLVRPGGALLLADFLPDSPCRRRYHHRSDVDLFTYKQDYAECFLALHTYELLAKSVFDHAAPELESSEVADQDRAGCFLLRKTLSGYRSL